VADEQHRLLAQPGDGDGGMRDALDRAKPVTDQLQLRIKLGAARELACELGKVTHPLHRTSAQPYMVKSSKILHLDGLINPSQTA
jgi:hypothetical protein